MPDKDLIIFDLDGTLAPSKSLLEPETARLLTQLIEKKKVAVISGGGFPQFENQLLKTLPVSFEKRENLLLLPTSGTRMYAWRGAWTEQYAERLGIKEKERIMIALNESLKAVGYQIPDKSFGPIIEDRGSQITFSALGQNAPLTLKAAWDPGRNKREAIAEILRRKIPGFDVRVGGTTSIDITKRGVNKGYGIRKLEEHLKIHLDKMLFVGDSLFHGGNDFPVKATGVDCIQVKNPEETRELIRKWLGLVNLASRKSDFNAAATLA